jgi:hypothetical protein
MESGNMSDFMITSQIKELAAAREKLAQLELAVETGLRQELSGLHEQYGFADVDSFLKAVKSAAGGGGRRKGRKAGRPKKVAVAPKTRKRALITAATRARVKQLVKAGNSGSQVARAVGISLPSVQNIKKALGLVKARGAKAKQVPTMKNPAKKRPVKKAPAKKAAAPTPPPAPAATPAE